MFENGRQISHYKILSALGAGGMGEVYLAEDARLERKVALKILTTEFAEDAARMHRFVQEAKAASALNHPNILTVHEIGESEGVNYIVTEYIEGETLRERLTGDSFPPGEILDIAIQIAEALAAAHAAGIVHRDVKPENVMIRRDGYAKVLDFGLAKLIEDKKPAFELEASTQKLFKTNPGVVMGTVSYMSPEQARGKETDARTDVWSFGVVLYEMLARRLPFEGETPNDYIASLLKSRPLTLRSKEIPDELKRIVRKALRRDADERYQTMKSLLADLKDLREDLTFSKKLEGFAGAERVGQTENQKTLIATREAADKTNRTRTAIAAEFVRTIKNRNLNYIVLSVSLLTTIGLLYWFVLRGAAVREQIESVAVMPFANESGSADNDYLSDGMTESLINSLSQIPKLNVKARSTVFRYKGRERDARAVGRELNVQAILNGRVTQRGDQLTLSLELIDVDTENVIWSERYNRRQTDLVALQSEIARDVSQKLKTKLTGAEERKLAKNYTENPEAYQLYLQGRYFWNKQTNKEVEKSLEYFQRAIALDPNYALAYAGIADALSLNVIGATRERMTKAYEAALKAVSLDPELAEAHTALGRILAAYDYDFAGAEREMRRAIELNANYATAHHFLGDLLSVLGRHTEAEVEFRRALELEPLSVPINSIYGSALISARRYDEGIARLKKTLEMDPNFAAAHARLSIAYHALGRYDESIEERAKFLELNGDSQSAAATRESFAKGGWRGFLLFMTGNDRPSNLSFYLQAVFLTALGEKDKAFAALEKSYENREISLTQGLKVDPRLDPLRDDPRYQELLKKVGFPQ
jgi:eukaryotic-like serine/threonine-protein kinase